MGLRIEKTDSMPVAAAKGAVAGGTVGLGVSIGSKIAPYAKDAYVKSKNSQKKLVKSWLGSKTKGRKTYRTAENWADAKRKALEKLPNADKKVYEKQLSKESKVIKLNENIGSIDEFKASKGLAAKTSVKSVKDKIVSTLKEFKNSESKMEWIKEHKVVKKIALPMLIGAGVFTLVGIGAKAISEAVGSKSKKEAD